MRCLRNTHTGFPPGAQAPNSRAGRARQGNWGAEGFGMLAVQGQSDLPLLV